MKIAVATGDLSILAPMSVKDAIWVDVERSLRLKDRHEEETAKYEFFDKRLDALHLLLLDTREILRHTDIYAQISALKESKHPKIEFFPDDRLPSIAITKEREKAEKRKKTLEVAGDGVKAIQEMSIKERLAAIRKEEEAEQSELVKRMWAHMANVRAAEKQQGEDSYQNIHTG